MKNWQHHYALAEEFLDLSVDPNTFGEERLRHIMRAQVHAKLASLKYRVQSEADILPQTYADLDPHRP